MKYHINIFFLRDWVSKIKEGRVSVEEEEGYTLYSLIIYGGSPSGTLGIAPKGVVCDHNAWERINANRYPTKDGDDLSVGFVSCTSTVFYHINVKI